MKERRFAAHFAAAALLAEIAADLGRGLPRDDRGQQFPKRLAILQVGELAILRPLAKAVECAYRQVFFIRNPAVRAGKSLAGKGEHLLDIAMPDSLRRHGVARRQAFEPESYFVVVHACTAPRFIFA